MVKNKFYLVTCNTWNGKNINLCVTNILNHAKALCMDYSNRNARYKEISDMQVLHILSTDFACQNAIRL